MKPLWVFAGLALLAVVFGAFEGHRASQATALRDSSLAVSAVRDSVDRMAVHAADSQSTLAAAELSSANRTQRRADSLMILVRRAPVHIPLPDSTTRDSVRYWRVTAESLQLALWAASQALDARTAEADTLRLAFAAQRAATAQLHGAYEGEHTRAEGLATALRKMPTGCRKLLGIPFPKFGAGAALTAHGLEPAVALVIPIGGC